MILSLKYKQLDENVHVPLNFAIIKIIALS